MDMLRCDISSHNSNNSFFIRKIYIPHPVTYLYKFVCLYTNTVLVNAIVIFVKIPFCKRIYRRRRIPSYL